MMDYGLLKESDPVYRQSSIIDHRSSMARAFALVEMLALVITAPILMVLFSGFYRGFLRDIPQGTRLLQENVTVLNMLDQLQGDMDRAISLPGQVGNRQAGDDLLLIGQPDGVIGYRFEPGRVVRSRLDERGAVVADGDRVWQARDAAVEWRPWVQDGRTYAVEVRSHLNQRESGKVHRKFVNSHVFFVGGLAAGGEIR